MAKSPKIKPLADRIVVKRLEAEEKTAGGIVLPDTAKEKPKQGEVVAVGEGTLNEEGERVPPRVKKGDRIVFGSYAGTEVTLDDEDYLILREDDVLALVEEKKKKKK
ncbi:MAG: co-chaperone GroES [Candidatus Brocadiia bacterium]